MSSSRTVLAGQKPTTAWAVSQRPSTIFLSMACASRKTRVASSPTTSSCRMSGYLPARSQVWKYGAQSMKGTSSARSMFLITRRPMNLGAGGW